MKLRFPTLLTIALACLTAVASAQSSSTPDPLPSWNAGASKKAIITFVEGVSKAGSPNFVPVEERVATFDNDGTLWAEQPMYFQLFFALDRIRELAPSHPEWKDTEPYRSVLDGDMKALAASGEEGLMKIVLASHAGISAEAYKESVRDWLKTARHPTTKKPFAQMVYQPMLELLNYLRAHDFKTYIVSGGGVDFMRVFTKQVYGIPPEQVVGSTLDAKFELVAGVPTIIKEGKLLLNDDKAGKPVGIYRHIGRRPVFAAGNSDGDIQMLEYTTVPRNSKDKRPNFGMLVHHTDAEREWAYDRKSHIGQLNKGLDDARARGWVIVDMKDDWSRIYPPE
ncbi:HAD family hydrolase [Dokdonella sp.]|uniref:HAD family hydrolase n=1 Tax=Dokdonella sp. TaxID=2291710 RepID=UPI003528E22F